MKIHLHKLTKLKPGGNKTEESRVVAERPRRLNVEVEELLERELLERRLERRRRRSETDSTRESMFTVTLYYMTSTQ